MAQINYDWLLEEVKKRYHYYDGQHEAYFRAYCETLDERIKPLWDKAQENADRYKNLWLYIIERRDRHIDEELETVFKMLKEAKK